MIKKQGISFLSVLTAALTKPRLTASILTLSMLTGCASTSISEAGYKRGGDPVAHPYAANKPGYGNELHRGIAKGQSKELDELAVIGVTLEFEFDEAAITESLQSSKPLDMDAGDSILVIQSGTEYPDSEMISSLSKYWEVSTLSGDARRYSQDNLNKLLRYTAASGGNDFVLIYWGVIETAEKNLHTKGVSWIPLVGWSLPDKKTSMRVVLKFVIIDVATGRWKTFQPTPVEDEFLSSIIERDGRSQTAEIEMKKAVYSNAADELFELMANDSLFGMMN